LTTNRDFFVCSIHRREQPLNRNFDSTRRVFLNRCGLGVGAAALAIHSTQEAVAAPSQGVLQTPHYAPKAKRMDMAKLSRIFCHKIEQATANRQRKLPGGTPGIATRQLTLPVRLIRTTHEGSR
jgi:hypothetical protein